MANRKTKKAKRNGSLAVVPPSAVYTSKKAELVNNGLDPFDESLKNGKPSYAHQSQKSGDYRTIGAVIKEYREKNRDCTYEEMYAVLHKRFPWIFEKETMVSGNVSKIINGDPLWRDCYFANRSEMIALAEIRIKEILKKDNTEDNIIISAYDKLMKYELIEKQNNNENDNSDNGVQFVFEED